MNNETECVYASLMESHKTLPLLAMVTNAGLLVVHVSHSNWSWVSKDTDLMQQVVCLAFSPQCTPVYLALGTNDKRVLVFKSESDGSSWILHETRSFRKRPFAITFSLDSKVLVADKSGLVHMISLSKDCQSAEEETEDSDEDDSCLGHYSTIIAMTMSVDGQYVITGDRDNKIRVSRYPNVWEIQSFCLSDPHFFVTRIWTLELEREWLFSVHHNGELKVWDGNSGIVKLRLSHSSVDCFLVDASAYVYDKHTVLVASIAYSSNHCWICILKYDSLRDEFHCHKEFKLELVDIPCCVEFDKLGTLWFSFWKQHIDKVAIHHDKQLLWESNNYNNTSSNNHKMTWNTFRLDTNSTMAKHLLWNRPSMLHELRKKEYVADWKGKKKPRTDNFKYPQ